MERYFMLIPEAVQLVMQAATLNDSGGTYVLDMGDQIKLVEMARNVIRLSGFVPDEEIAIKFIGPRPGEKLSEELVASDEIVEPSGIEKILRVQSLTETNSAMLADQIWKVEQLAARSMTPHVLSQLAEIVPTFRQQVPQPQRPVDAGRLRPAAPDTVAAVAHS
jgi:FlaA1/EpsC-like NDP-sugar epimerase